MKKLKEHLDSRLTKTCVYAGATVIAVCVLLFLLYLTGGFWGKLWTLFLTVLRPIVIGGIICYLITPIVNRVEALFRGKKSTSDEKRWTRPVAVFLGFLIVLVVIALLLLLITVTMYRSIASINMNSVMDVLSAAQNDLASFIASIAERLEEIGLSSDRLGNLVSSLVGGVKNIASGLLFGVIFAIYYLLDGARIGAYWKRVFRLFAGDRTAEALDTFASDADRVFSGYIRGQFIDAIIVGVLSSIALLIAGVPNAIVVGVLVGLGNLIPYVGPLLGFITLVLVCIPTAVWGKLLVGAIILVVVMLVDSNLINPRLLSSNIKIHPLLVVAALIGGGALGGIVGMIIAVPIAAMLKTQLDRQLDKKEREVQSLSKSEI